MKNRSLISVILLLTLSPLMGPTYAFGQSAPIQEFYLMGIQTSVEQDTKTQKAFKRIQEGIKKLLTEEGWQHASYGATKSNQRHQQKDLDQENLLQTTLDRAKHTYENDSIEEALPVYLDAIRILASFKRPSSEQVQTLAQLRLNTANRLLALKGFETKANELLKDALKANPHLELNTAQFPPRLRKRFAQIRNSWAEENKNDFMIRSIPSQAVVYVEGHSVGLTPLHLLNHLGAGTYRIWVEKEGTRSSTRTLTVDTEKVDVSFDIQTDYYFKAASQSFHLDPQEVQLYSFLSSLQQTKTARPFVLTGILVSDKDWDVFSIKVEPKNISFIKTTVPSLSESVLRDVTVKHAQAISNDTLKALTKNNFFNPQAVQIKSPKISKWQTWGLLGVSTLVLGATISTAFLLWPTVEEEGHLQISVVP